MKTVALFLALVSPLATIWADVPFAGGLKLKDFRYQGGDFYVMGREAKIDGQRFRVTQARIVFNGDDGKIYLKTPSMAHDRSRDWITGGGEVEIRGRTFILTGKGFDVNLKERRFVIRKKVRMKIIGKKI